MRVIVWLDPGVLFREGRGGGLVLVYVELRLGDGCGLRFLSTGVFERWLALAGAAGSGRGFGLEELSLSMASPDGRQEQGRRRKEPVFSKDTHISTARRSPFRSTIVQTAYVCRGSSSENKGRGPAVLSIVIERPESTWPTMNALRVLTPKIFPVYST